LPSETTEVLFARYGPRYRWLATGTVMLGTISAVLTTTTVNVAIPDIMGTFGIGQDRAQWLSTGALAAMTIAMLLNAWMIRSFGQRKTFIGALGVFMAAGLLLMPGGLVLGLFFPIGGYLSDRLPAQGLIITGLVCFGVSAYWLGSVDANTPFWSIAWCVVVSRIGLGLIKPALNVTALRALRPELLGQGAGMINFSRQLGGAFGVNLLSVVLDRRTFFHSNALANLQTAANSGTADFLRRMQDLLAQSGVPQDLQLPGALHFLDRVVYAQAYTLGFRDSFLIVALVFALALVPAWIMGKTRAGQSA
jgi:MFS family permease